MNAMQEQNHSDPFFTIIVVVIDLEHLMAKTLDSIVSQTHQDFEIVVIEAREYHRIGHVLQSYPEHRIQLYSDYQDNMGKIMSNALKKAKGKYVHYLFSGDTYLSKYHLQQVRDLIDQNQDPEYLYSAYLRKIEGEFPSASFRKMTPGLLSKGEMACTFQSIWFLRSAIEKYGGIRSEYRYRPLFALMCNMVLNHARSIFCPKVLTDYELRMWSTRKVTLFFLESFFILHKKFGWKSSLFWWFSQDQIQLIKLLLRYLKKVFWET